ncbi:hypothetical protein OH76DRAFT_402906 [Lentinus brumalis]|uniref:Uncharacterized protein n=1 Tax=Lentinus brumalis TaxID=2498619 RepID=A0A371DVP9_9APHY|nr:hypothetical protein OH76DRAFT_402906 [Polyporus brumalis]
MWTWMLASRTPLWGRGVTNVETRDSPTVCFGPLSGRNTNHMRDPGPWKVTQHTSGSHMHNLCDRSYPRDPHVGGHTNHKHPR